MGLGKLDGPFIGLFIEVDPIAHIPVVGNIHKADGRIRLFVLQDAHRPVKEPGLEMYVGDHEGFQNGFLHSIRLKGFYVYK